MESRPGYLADNNSAGPEAFASMRESYGHNAPLDPADLREGWWMLLQRWIDEAASAGAREPNAMVIATVDGEGAHLQPQTRTVLCKTISPAGVQFFTTRTSRKGRALAAHPVASVTFPLLERERQVHLSGTVHPLDDAVSAEYWKQRPRGSQIAAWASSQSEPIDSLDALRARFSAETARFGGEDSAAPVPMPPYWGGYELRPVRVEFWQGGADRFHDRLEATLAGDSAAGTAGNPHEPLAWTIRRLQP